MHRSRSLREAYMSQRRLNILHAIHDFLPRHQAGSEIYAFELCSELQNRHHVTMLCADYDGSRPHGQVTWRLHQGLPVVEVVNNWTGASFAHSYRPPLIGARVARILDAVQPDILHLHSLLNLTFDLPTMAHAVGTPVVATLHDYTLVCPTGGQRVHRAEQHVCHTIEPDRCARCFSESPFFAQMTLGRVAAVTRAPAIVQRAARILHRLSPRIAGWTARAMGRAAAPSIDAADITDRLDAARAVFRDVDQFVAPSASLAVEYERLGIDRSKLRVSDYGFRQLTRRPQHAPSIPLRLGYVGSIVWHKGVHVLLDAARRLPASTWSLQIFGSPDVSPDYVASLRARAAGLPVQFMGGFERDRTAEVFSQIDVLVVPSLWLENSPLVIHEAFMAGVPIVGARIGGIADLVADGLNGLLYEPTSADALCNAIRLLIDDPDRVTQLSERSPPVKSIQDDAAEWEQIYAGLLDLPTE